MLHASELAPKISIPDGKRQSHPSHWRASVWSHTDASKNHSRAPESDGVMALTAPNSQRASIRVAVVFGGDSSEQNVPTMAPSSGGR
jgi:hypothetical protein